MKTIYLGIGDLYLPATAAAVHLGHLDGKTPPARDALLQLPYCHAAEKEDDGRLIYAGEDARGNQVYVACVKGHPDVMIRGVESLLGVCQISLAEVQVMPCVPENPQVALICRLLIRLGLQSTADLIAFRLIRNRYADLAKLGAQSATV